MKLPLKFKKYQQWLLVSLVFLSLLPIYLLTTQATRYQQPIARVAGVTELSQEQTTDEYQNQDVEGVQELQLIIENGDYQGQAVKVLNHYVVSGIQNQSYRKGDRLFVSLTYKESSDLVVTIEGVKRDSYLALLAILFIVLLLIVGQKSGLFSVISLLINGVLLSFLIDFFIDSQTTQLLLFFSLAVPLFVIISLLVVSGWTKKTLAAVIATLLGTFLSFLLGWTVIMYLNHKGLRYEEMGFVTRPPHDIFLASLLIGCLGAVMDVAMTIASSLVELRRKNSLLPKAELLASGKAIGKDVMGPMANVLLFSYLSGSLPVMILFVRNQMSFQYLFSLVLSLELARALVGSIGIVLTVPLAVHTTVAVLEFRRKSK